MSLVGIIANPASGKDIRRLVAFGSVFDNQEKVRIVRRVLLGLLAAGVERFCFMPDYYGIVLRAAEGLKLGRPLFPMNFKPTATQEDSTLAARLMAERGVDAVVTLGGDGTNRAVAKGLGAAAPLTPISTGTNNVFPTMVEGTIAGLATGLLATGRVPREEACYHSTRLVVRRGGEETDSALVDAAVCADAFVGSRAVWELDRVRQLVLNRAAPENIGLSALGGQLELIRPEEPRALYLRPGPGGRAVTAPVAPGVIQTVAIAEERILGPGDWVPVLGWPAVVALDGEREVEAREGELLELGLAPDGPLVVDIPRTMASAMRRGVLTPLAPAAAGF